MEDNFDPAEQSEQSEEGIPETPPEVSKDAKNMGMLCHLLGLLTNFLGPLILWIVKKDDDPFIDDQGKEALNTDLRLLQQQVQSCKRILQGLVATAETHSQGQQQQVIVTDYIKKILDHWQVLRPQARYQYSQKQTSTPPTLLVDSTLEQAIANLLNNASDASDQAQEIKLEWNAEAITLSIRDHGPGIAMEIAEQLGKPFFSTKGKGLGLGLFLSHASVARYGGKITLHNHPQGGTLAQLSLPTRNLIL